MAGSNIKKSFCSGKKNSYTGFNDGSIETMVIIIIIIIIVYIDRVPYFYF